VHGFSQAILKRGLPRALLTDHGSAMIAAETRRGSPAWASCTTPRCPTGLTGARVGELTGLTWPDVNFQTGRFTIRRSLSWAKLRDQKDSKPRFYEPKTKAGKRTIDLAPELLSALKRWKLACPKGPLNLVFPTQDGTPKHRSTITHHALRPALKAARLRQVARHSLRHTCASALILSGADTLEVAKFLGHSKPTVTLSVYAHWFNTRRTGRTMATVAGAVFGDRGSSMVAVGRPRLAG